MIRPQGATQNTGDKTRPIQLSLNWSGYAATSTKKFNFVHSEYIQPAIRCNGKPYTISSNWVGLDGFSSQTVEQDGTDALCAGPDHMTPRYSAWYEMYPAPSVRVFGVHPGDVIDAQVTYSAGMFTTTITDVSSGKTSGTTAACDQCERSSAEWIVERPAFCANHACTQGILAALPDFGTTTLSNATARVDGSPRAKAINGFVNIPIDMYQPTKTGRDKLLDTTETLSQQGHSFDEVWQAWGKPLLLQF
jgi:hypothetical protein